MKIKLIAMLAAMMLAGTAAAQDQECHVKGADGKGTIDATLTTKEACEAKKGEWKHHHAFCQKEKDGKKNKDTSKKTQAECEAAGEKWVDNSGE